MAQFHLHPDGQVIIRTNDGKVYIETYDNFTADAALENKPELPPDTREVIYDDITGVFCAISADGNNQRAAPPALLPIAKHAIAQAETMLTTKHARDESARQKSLAERQARDAALTRSATAATQPTP